ncbi:hypothetical protein PhiH1_015 [Halobacterium phage phiH]|uniref:Uncharacterized protein n=1 Tax=Halobacterium phage phiH TaxID=169684 RepID=A0A3G1ZKP1_BPPHH|nr:hypothetical protein JR051_gp04 [Halobacterium phage phiH]AYM00250.1 hypothetical protein PhiH1_015 [Halobacterium phage phiH]
MVTRKDDTEDDEESRSKYGIVGGEDTVDDIRSTLDEDENDDE